MMLFIFQIIDEAKDHLQLVKDERCAYRNACKSARQNFKNAFTIDGVCQSPVPDSMVQPLSNKTVMHYSFNMAQQVNRHLK